MEWLKHSQRALKDLYTSANQSGPLPVGVVLGCRTGKKLQNQTKNTEAGFDGPVAPATTSELTKRDGMCGGKYGRLGLAKRYQSKVTEKWVD